MMTNRILCENGASIATQGDEGGSDRRVPGHLPGHLPVYLPGHLPGHPQNCLPKTTTMRVDMTGNLVANDIDVKVNINVNVNVNNGSSPPRKERAPSRPRPGRRNTTIEPPHKIGTDDVVDRLKILSAGYHDHQRLSSSYRERIHKQRIRNRKEQIIPDTSIRLEGHDKSDHDDSKPMNLDMDEPENTQEQHSDLCISKIQPSMTTTTTTTTSNITTTKLDIEEKDLVTAAFIRRKIRALEDVANSTTLPPPESPDERENCNDDDDPLSLETVYDPDEYNASLSYLLDRHAKRKTNLPSNPLANKISEPSHSSDNRKYADHATKTTCFSSVNPAGEIVTTNRNNNFKINSRITHGLTVLSGQSSTNFVSHNQTKETETKPTLSNGKSVGAWQSEDLTQLLCSDPSTSSETETGETISISTNETKNETDGSASGLNETVSTCSSSSDEVPTGGPPPDEESGTNAISPPGSNSSVGSTPSTALRTKATTLTTTTMMMTTSRIIMVIIVIFGVGMLLGYSSYMSSNSEY